ncbi:MAG TPA: acyl-ACP desaturase [Candidatus Saccharimonadales bacterium]|nr:acyl-ACP desaturase [Candidatus Saccharimonadales bacterium]
MAESGQDTNQMLVAELEPEVERLLNRHDGAAKEWFPHEFVPWDRGTDFEPGETWDPDAFPLSDEVRSALFVNLLTEDNLPYYFRTIEQMFGKDSAWGTWVRRWTAEEGRHSIVIRDYLTVSRAIDPVALERARMAQVKKGEVPQPPSPPDGLGYVALQELATRIAHRNTGRLLGDKAGQEVMDRVSRDENLHYLFYRDLVTAALELDPSVTVIAIERQVRDFEMPGTGIVDFGTHAKAIARAGIYDLQIHHDEILQPVLKNHWKIEDLEGLTPEAEQARERLMDYMARLGKVAGRFLARKEAKAVTV